MTKCSKKALDIKTYYAGKDQVTHPNVITFASEWNGYKYYMGYTSYPYSDGSRESPCIAASNDLFHWEKPDDTINPIACCEETECDELKDTHLLYNSDLDQLEMWYLGRLASTEQNNGPLYCFRKTSKDGRHWGPFEAMYCFAEQPLCSESIMYQKGKGYCFWGIKNTPLEKAVYYMDSQDGKEWSHFEKCSIPGIERTDVWHGSVTLIDDEFHFVWVGLSGKERNKVYHSTSKDGLSFSQVQTILINDARWEHLYRPDLIKVDGCYYCFYGVKRIDGKWLICLSTGESLERLEGYPAINAFDVLTMGSEAFSGKLFLHAVIMRVRSRFIPSLLVLIVPLFICRVFYNQSIVLWLLSCFISAIYCCLRISKKHAITSGIYMGTMTSAIAFLIVEFLNNVYILVK